MFNQYMNAALSEAVKAFKIGEVPVGAVIVKDKKIIAFAHNVREKFNNPLAHAEICAINIACGILGNWRLSDCDMYVTLEPCPMCSGAILQSRIKNLYFGAYNTENGCMGTIINMAKMLKDNNITVYGGIMEDECSSLIKKFFRKSD